MDNAILENNNIDFKNLSSNKSRKKKKTINQYGVVTDLVKRFQSTKDKDILLEIINSLEGIINSYTIMMTPGSDSYSAIYITSNMKKFLGMFLTQEEKIDTNNDTYKKVMQRIKWIVRDMSYEDIYSKIVEIIIHIVSTMKIIGTCDCIYYIQMLIKYRVYGLIIKTAKDATVNIMAIEQALNPDTETIDDTIDKLNYFSLDTDFEEELMYKCLYNDIGINCLFETKDIFKHFTQYEKYLIYLKYGLNLYQRQIKAVLLFESKNDIDFSYDIIDKTIAEIREEENNI